MTLREEIIQRLKTVITANNKAKQLYSDLLTIFSALIIPSPSISSVNSIGLGSVIVKKVVSLGQLEESNT